MARTKDRQLLLVDAGMAAGFRRATPSLAQADQIIEQLRGDDSLEVVVLADAGLKHDLERSEQDRFETMRSTGQVICAAAGTRDGHTGFMRAVAEQAAARAGRGAEFRRVLVLTARDLGEGGWTLARLTRDREGHWSLA